MSLQNASSTDVPPLTKMPMVRAAGCPFDPPPELAGLRDESPVRRLVFPDGHVGWFVSGHAEIRAILADPRVSSRYELMHYPLPDVEFGTIPKALPGDLTGIDPPEHTRYRKQLTGKFTVRRMRLLTERVEQIVAEHLDAMSRQDVPVDLVETFAQPVPALIICELLGVPYAERDYFRLLVSKTANMDGGGLDAAMAAMSELNEYVKKLTVAKRATPTDDLLSDLAADTDFTDEELGGVGGFLLGAGLDTVTNMLALGTFALLTKPDQLAIMRDEPENTDTAIEELMRYLSIAHTGARAATDDIEIAGQTIKAGDTIVLSVQAANRDPNQFPDPDTLDLHRKATGQLGFGFGVHQCLGQQLARVQMRVAFPALFQRFPTLRLAVSPNEVRLRAADQSIYGVVNLPVTWDQ